MITVSPKNKEPENRSPIRRMAPQRSWKSSDSLVSVAPASSLSLPVSPSRRGSNGSDYSDDENTSEDNKRGSNLTRSKSSSATSPRRVSRGMPSSRLHLPSQEEHSSFPDRSNGLSRWKSTSQCLRASSIPEDSCLLSLNKKHPADTNPPTDDSPRMPGQPKTTSSFSTDICNNAINMIVEDDEFAAPPPPIPRPITMMRRHQSELVPQRGMLLDMQQSLASSSSSASPETSSSKRRGGDDRPAPPRRAPSRSASECATRAPLQRSLSRNTSMRRAPVARPEEEEEPQQQQHDVSSPTSRDNVSSGRRPAPPRRAPSRTISESVSTASTPPLQRSPSRLTSMVRRPDGDAAPLEDEKEEPQGSESICAGRPSPPRRLPSRSVSERVVPPLQRTLSRHNSIKRPHPAAALSRE